MILRRLGNKSKLAKKIQIHFPPHKIYIEPFFGAGGMFFNKPKAKYNIVNDLDGDVFNLYQIIINKKEELKRALRMVPIHSDLLKYWRHNKESDPIKKALRFLFLSNLVDNSMGGSYIDRKCYSNDKDICILDMDKVFEFIINTNIRFHNSDFRKFINQLYWHKDRLKEKINTFIYNDPPYLGVSNNYDTVLFTEADSFDLFEANQKTGCKWAMSEFDQPFILEQAKERGLNVITIGERRNLKNKRIEILVINYKKVVKSLF